MEEKGFLKSEFGEATAVRGGKRKRIYTATPLAVQTLKEIKEVRTQLWASIA
jgi:DNA-binding PadR family transcriptional regulator